MANDLVKITLSQLGDDQGPFFDIYHTAVFPENLLYEDVLKNQLTNGFDAAIPEGTTRVIVKSKGVCDTENSWNFYDPEAPDLPSDDIIVCPCTASSTYDDCLRFYINNPTIFPARFTYQTCWGANTSILVGPGENVFFDSLTEPTQTTSIDEVVVTGGQRTPDAEVSLHLGGFRHYRVTPCDYEDTREFIVRRSTNLSALEVDDAVNLKVSPCFYRVIGETGPLPSIEVHNAFINCEDRCSDSLDSRDIQVGYSAATAAEAYQNFEDGIFITIYLNGLDTIFEVFDNRQNPDRDQNLYEADTLTNRRRPGFYYEGFTLSGQGLIYYWNGQAIEYVITPRNLL